MMTVHLIADSASDLPKSYIEENRIGFIPLHVTLDGNEYEDAVTIQADHIFQAMRDGKFRKTSQASPDTIKSIFTIRGTGRTGDIHRLFLRSFRHLSDGRNDRQ